MAEMKKGDCAANESKFESQILPVLRVYGRAVEEANDAAVLGTGVQYKDISLGPDTKVKARLYLPKSKSADDVKKLPILLYFHGGGFFMGSAFGRSSHSLVEALSHQSRLLAVSVEYRLNDAPGAYDDALAALKWVFSGADEWVAKHGDLEHVFAAGDSAGANITHNLAMEYTSKQPGNRSSGEMKIEGIALLCPYFWGVDPLPGEITDQCIRNVVCAAWLYVRLLPTDGRVNPLAPGAPSLEGLGCDKVFVCLADQDPFYPRGNAYVDGVKESGWKGELHPQVYTNVGHVFFENNLKSDMAKKLLADLLDFFGTN